MDGLAFVRGVNQMHSITDRNNFRQRESNGLSTPRSSTKSRHSLTSTANKSFRYMRRQPTIVQYDTEERANSFRDSANNNVNAIKTNEVHFDVVVTDSGKLRRRVLPGQGSDIYEEGGPGKKMMLKKPLEVS
jgi:hypothetical protein